MTAGEEALERARQNQASGKAGRYVGTSAEDKRAARKAELLLGQARHAADEACGAHRRSAIGHLIDSVRALGDLCGHLVNRPR